MSYKKICGIYKITSPSGRVYIGQSKNLIVRLKRYKAMHKSIENQVKLHRSFKKYGVKNHIFEIIEECEFEKLNIRERYWQDYYDVLNGGLNCILTETDELPRVITKQHLEKISGENHWTKSKSFSEETKKKMSESAKNKIVSQETKDLLSSIRKGENNNFFGKKHTKESKKIMSESAKNRNITPENEQKRRDGISRNKLGKNISEKHKESLRESKKGTKNPMYGKKGELNPRSKKVVQMDLKDNFLKEWVSATEVENILGINKTSVGRCCSKKQKTAGGYKWRFLDSVNTIS